MADRGEFSSPGAIASAYGAHALAHDEAGRAYWQQDREFVDRFIGLAPSRGSILDVSAGAGNQSAYFADLGFQITMTDGTQDMLDLAKSHVPSAEIALAVLPDLPLPNDAFDAVFCRHVLHHLELSAVEQSIRNMERVARAGAHIGLVMSVSPGEQSQTGWYEIAEGQSIRQYFHPQAALRGIFDGLGLVTVEYNADVIQTTEEKTSGMPVLRTVLRKTSDVSI